MGRVRAESGVYHAVLRGVNRQNIFESDRDRERFSEQASEVARLEAAAVLAHCLMSNHVHFVIEEGEQPIGHFFQRLGSRYVPWYNERYDRVGPLWQGRFKSRPVGTSGDLVNVIRYVHHNPVAANLVADPRQYRWSSAYGQSQLSDAVRAMTLCGVHDRAELNRPPVSAAAQLDPGPIRRAMNDDEAWALVFGAVAVRDASAFQALPLSAQVIATRSALEHGVSLRRLARMTGISRPTLTRRARLEP
ncbi:MAG: transposase [Bifidobacteriaceae bacterium]|jgi:REP element-mobilizing transposase RayT|nr:transposase [Bifidobacteriaceae bacterium]